MIEVDYCAGRLNKKGPLRGPLDGRSEVSLLAARTVTATAAGGIAGRARVVAAVVVIVVGHVLILSTIRGEAIRFGLSGWFVGLTAIL